MRRLLPFLLISLLYSSCSKQQKREIKGGPASYGDTVRLAIPEPISTLHPLYNDDIYSHRILSNLFEPLFDVDSKTLAIIPRLAERYEWRENGTQLILHIRKGVQFHEDDCFEGDSKFLTAKDVKFSLEMACSSEKINQSNNAILGLIVGSKDYYLKKATNVAGIKIINDYCISLQLTGPCKNLPLILSSSKYGICSQKAFSHYGSNTINHPVGTGPFMLLKNLKHQITLTYHPEYWEKDAYGNQLPYLDAIQYSVYQGSDREIRDFSLQKLDFLLDLPSEKINNVFQGSKKPFAHRVLVVPGSSVGMIVLNKAYACFKDPKVREAIDLVIDRDYIASSILNGDATAAKWGVAPPTSFYKSAQLPEKKINIPIAQQLMRTAGYTANNPFPALDFYVAGDYPELTKKYCDYIVKTLRETLNISIRVHYTTMEERINAVKNRTAGLWKIAISPDYPDATSLFSLFLSSQPSGIEKNLLLPEIDSKSFAQNLQFAFQESNNELKNHSLAACDSILMSEKWALPLVYWDNIIIQNLRVRQINISPIGTFDFKNTYIKPL